MDIVQSFDASGNLLATHESFQIAKDSWLLSFSNVTFREWESSCLTDVLVNSVKIGSIKWLHVGYESERFDRYNESTINPY